MTSDGNPVVVIEAAMVRIRRMQGRRRLGERAAPAGTGLSPAAYQALDAVEAGESAGAVTTVSGVAADLGVDQPRASRLVAALVEAGLVRRVADQSDGRRATLVRTAAGRRVCERMHRSRRAAFETALAGWGTEDREQFARLLDRFASDVDAHV